MQFQCNNDHGDCTQHVSMVPSPRLWRVPGAGGVEPAAGHRIQVSKVTFRLVIRIVTLSVK